MTNVFHVTPMRYLTGHDTSSAEPDCACRPQVGLAPQEDGSMGWLLAHHSLDGREQVEG